MKQRWHLRTNEVKKHIKKLSMMDEMREMEKKRTGDDRKKSDD